MQGAQVRSLVKELDPAIKRILMLQLNPCTANKLKKKKKNLPQSWQTWGQCWVWVQKLLDNNFIFLNLSFLIYQFRSVTQSCPTLCDPMDCSMPGLPVHHQLLEFTQTHVHWVGDAIQPSHPLSSPSPTFNLSQHKGLFKWVSSLPQVSNVLEFQLQHQSFQWTPRTDFL